MAATLSVFYQNVRGLRTKADDFMPNLATTKYDVVCLTETWLRDGIPDSHYFTPSYKVYRRDRDYQTTGQKYGGGVLIACESSLSSHRRPDL